MKKLTGLPTLPDTYPPRGAPYAQHAPAFGSQVVYKPVNLRSLKVRRRQVTEQTYHLPQLPGVHLSVDIDVINIPII